MLRFFVGFSAIFEKPHKNNFLKIFFFNFQLSIDITWFIKVFSPEFDFSLFIIIRGFAYFSSVFMSKKACIEMTHV